MFASEEAEDGRHFNRTLDELDQTTLVRDRSGASPPEDASAEEESEEVEADEHAPSSKSYGKATLEDEWGLSQPSKHRSTHHDGDEDDSDVEEEVRFTDRTVTNVSGDV